MLKSPMTNGWRKEQGLTDAACISFFNAFGVHIEIGTVIYFSPNWPLSETLISEFMRSKGPLNVPGSVAEDI